MNDADSYYRELERRDSTTRIRPPDDDTFDRAIAAIGEPLSPSRVEAV